MSQILYSKSGHFHKEYNHTAVDTYNTGKIGTITLKEATMNLQKVVVKAERGHVVKKKGNVKTFFFSHHANETKDIYTALTEVPDLRIDPTMKTISLAKGGAPLVLIDGIPKSHSLARISPAMIAKQRSFGIYGTGIFRCCQYHNQKT